MISKTPSDRKTALLMFHYVVHEEQPRDRAGSHEETLPPCVIFRDFLYKLTKNETRLAQHIWLNNLCLVVVSCIQVYVRLVPLGFDAV